MHGNVTLFRSVFALAIVLLALTHVAAFAGVVDPLPLLGLASAGTVALLCAADVPHESGWKRWRARLIFAVFAAITLAALSYVALGAAPPALETFMITQLVALSGGFVLLGRGPHGRGARRIGMTTLALVVVLHYGLLAAGIPVFGAAGGPLMLAPMLVMFGALGRGHMNEDPFLVLGAMLGTAGILAMLVAGRGALGALPEAEAVPITYAAQVGFAPMLLLAVYARAIGAGEPRWDLASLVAAAAIFGSVGLVELTVPGPSPLFAPLLRWPLAAVLPASMLCAGRALSAPLRMYHSGEA